MIVNHSDITFLYITVQIMFGIGLISCVFCIAQHLVVICCGRAALN